MPVKRHPFWHRCLIGAMCAPLTLLVGSVSAQEPVGIYEDHVSDAPFTQDKPVRIRLKKSPDVALGRIGGVWGALGDGDDGDSFFVGKTPDLTNLQVSVHTPDGSPAVTCVFKATDGQDVETVRLESVPGTTTKQWVSLKGKISVDVLAGSDQPTNYALYIWYPGGTVDSLNAREIAEISTGDYAEKPVIFTSRRRQ